jgi:O-antigen/teichoic acid export membrane protein
VLGLSLLYVLSVSGLLLGVILSYSIVLGYLVYTGKLNLQIKVDPVVLKKLLAVGLPMLLVSISGLLAYRIDSLVVYLLLGEESTGYFGIAVFIVLIVSNIPSSISYVIFPRMMSDMRENGEASVVARYTKMSTAFVAGFSPLFLGAIFICIGPILTLALSDYLAAIDCLHILIIALYFFSLQDMYSVALVAMGKQVATAAIQTTVVLLGGFLDVVVIKAGFGIEGVAIMTALTFYLLFLLLKTSAMRAWGSSPADMLSAMATKHVSFFFLLGALWLVRFLLDDSATSVLRLLGQLGLYVLITAPYLVFYLGRQYPQALQSLWRRDARPQEPIE